MTMLSLLMQEFIYTPPPTPDPMTVFNVMDYGAVNNGSNTNQSKNLNKLAFEHAFDLVAARGAGRVWVPWGHYVTDPIKIPGYDYDTATDPYGTGFKNIEIVGECAPVQLFGTVGVAPINTGGSIIRCESAIVGESIFEVETFNGAFSSAQITLRDLEFRVPDGPFIDGFNAYWASQFRAQNLQINTGVYSVEAVDPQINSINSCGLITPSTGNGAINLVSNVSVSGYMRGIWVGEHFEGHHLNLTCNKHALVMGTSSHSAYISRMSSQRCTHGILVEGACKFNIAQMNIEHPNLGQTNAGNAWQMSVTDLHDAGNLATDSSINYYVIEGGTPTPNYVFNKNKGDAVICRAGSREERMTTAEINALTTSVIVPGRTIYDTTANKTKTWDGSTWQVHW